MRNLKSFKLFIESLQDDFDNSVKDLENKKDAEEFANEQNANSEKIEAGKILIDRLREFSGDEYI